MGQIPGTRHHPQGAIVSELLFILVIIFAMAHGYWNFLFKQAEDKDAFLGLSKLVEPLIYLFPFLYVLGRYGLDLSALYFVGVGALLSVTNYLLLANTYKRLDLSLAYPISRSSTLFLPFLAYLFFSERIDAIGWISVILVSLGVLVIPANRRIGCTLNLIPAPEERCGLVLAVLAALSVAIYSLWDRVAISHMHPFIYMYCYNTATVLFFAPFLKKLKKETIANEWKKNSWRIASVAFFNTFSYVLMLFALSMSKVTYVGALRQLSLVFGVALGWMFLKEKLNRPRIAGLILIIIGASLTYLAK